MRPVTVLLACLLIFSQAGEAGAWELPLQCVPFARAVSGVQLFGDAWRWWSEAVGRYDRGQIPQPGSILSFRSSAAMPLGHVAVVTRVINPRQVEIDQANWVSPGAVTTGMRAIDVSDRNDWSAVRVELAGRGGFGSVYATDGFIYAKGRSPSAQRAELIYVGRALAAARRSPGFAVAPSVVTPVSGALSPLLPWNPIPLAPAIPGQDPGRRFGR
jgi:surface antigen